MRDAMPLKISSIKAFLTLCLLALKKYPMVFGTETKRGIVAWPGFIKRVALQSKQRFYLCMGI
jgi:hypothetical protein